VSSTRLKAVIFDLDGTLVTFNLDVKACRTEIISRLTEQGFPRSLFSMKETAFDMLMKIRKHLVTKGIKDQNVANIKKMIFSTVERYELDAARTTEMFQGIPETLKALKDMHLKIGLCTISGEKATQYLLKRFNVGSFFDAVVTRDSVSEVKPHPTHLKKVLEALNVLPRNAVLVGDSVKDVACANHFNVLAVGVTTGLSSIEELTHSGAHYIASSANEVPKLIMQLEKQTSM
jgi:HAD superfamily hydrolase (TIGR01549 family)